MTLVHMRNSKPRTSERSMVLRDPAFLGEIMKRAGEGGAPVSNAELAQFADCDRRFIWQLRKGERPGCRETTAKRIAAYLKVDVGLLFVPRASQPRSQDVKDVAV